MFYYRYVPANFTDDPKTWPRCQCGCGKPTPPIGAIIEILETPKPFYAGKTIPAGKQFVIIGYDDDNDSNGVTVLAQESWNLIKNVALEDRRVVALYWRAFRDAGEMTVISYSGTAFPFKVIGPHPDYAAAYEKLRKLNLPTDGYGPPAE